MANTIVAIGGAVKVIGVVLAVLIFLVSLLGGANLGGPSGTAAFLSFLTGAVVGGVVGLLFWLLGVLISSQGQVLLASLDTAVNGSPFITDDDRAAAMSLPDGEQRSEAAPVAATLTGADQRTSTSAHGQRTIQPGERTITCPQCSVVNPATAFYCNSCKRNLHM